MSLGYDIGSREKSCQKYSLQQKQESKGRENIHYARAGQPSPNRERRSQDVTAEPKIFW